MKNWYSGAEPGETPWALVLGVAMSCERQPLGGSSRDDLLLFRAAIAARFFGDRAVGHVGDRVAVFRREDHSAFPRQRFDRGAVLVGRRHDLPGAAIGQREGLCSRSGW